MPALKQIAFGKLFLASLLISFILPSCVSLKEPEFKYVDKLKLNKFSLGSSSLSMSISYYNPNSMGVKLKNAEGDAWADDQFIGHFYMDTLVNIQPHALFEIPVKMNVETGSLFRYSLNSVGAKDILIRVDGKAKLGKGNIYIRYPIKYEGRYKLADLLGF